MRVGTVILLHSPDASAGAWGDLPEMLRSYGLDVVAPDVPGAAGMRYVARASLVVAATAPTAPLVLVGHRGAGPLLPAIGTAQRAAHRPIGGYVFIDAELPAARPPHLHAVEHTAGHAAGHAASGGRAGAGPADEGPGDEVPAPVPADWPEAPCGYLRMSAERAAQAQQARLRGWPVKDLPETVEPAPVAAVPPPGAAQALSELIATL